MHLFRILQSIFKAFSDFTSCVKNKKKNKKQLIPIAIHFLWKYYVKYSTRCDIIYGAPVTLIFYGLFASELIALLWSLCHNTVNTEDGDMWQVPSLRIKPGMMWLCTTPWYPHPFILSVLSSWWCIDLRQHQTINTLHIFSLVIFQLFSPQPCPKKYSHSCCTMWLSLSRALQWFYLEIYSWKCMKIQSLIWFRCKSRA